MLQVILNFIKSNYKTIIKLSFGVFILYYLIFFLTPKVQMSVEQKNKIDSLNILVKDLHQDNLKIEKEISEFENEVVEIDQNIQNIKGEKTIIKEYYHEKISNVDKLSVPELDSFFSKRYEY
jgi:vacuolar-type H+-ATPase subunit I/STV1